MWTNLQHARHREFYEEWHAGSGAAEEDWQPMVRVVQFLQQQAFAPRLFAFTSLAHFHVTTAPNYAACDGHDFVRVTWAYPERLFRLSYGSCDAGWADELPFEACDEASFSTRIEPFIQRLLRFRPASEK